VERGEKSISVDSLYRVAVALDIPLRDLIDIRPNKGLASSSDAEKVFALLADRHQPAAMRRAYRVLQGVFKERRAGAPAR
jgi:hypothetical protein